MSADPESQATETAAEDATADEAAASAEEVSADLDRLLEDTKRERDEYLELAQRARADFENYRKRAASDALAAERRGRVTLAKELVPVMDSLERALESANGGSEALTKGVELVHRELGDALARAGVEPYDPAGEAFDPAWHEAIATRPGEGAKPGIVLETVDKGYRLDGQVLRAARVVVAE